MISILVAIASFLFPGFGQGLVARRRSSLVWAALGVVSLIGIVLSVWTLIFWLAVRTVSAIDAFLGYRRTPPAARSDWFGAIAIGIQIVVALLAQRFVLEAFKMPSSSMYPTLQIDDHIYVDKLSIKWRSPERGEVIVFQHPCEPAKDYLKRVIAIESDTVEVRCSVVYINGKPIPSRLTEASAKYENRITDGEPWVTEQCSRYEETIGDLVYEIFHDYERPGRDNERRAAPESGSGDAHDFPQIPVPPTCDNYRDPNAAALSSSPQNQKPGKVVVTRPSPLPHQACEPHMHYVVPPDSLFVLGDNRSNSHDSRVWGVVPEDYVIGRTIGIWLPLNRIGGVK